MILPGGFVTRREAAADLAGRRRFDDGKLGGPASEPMGVKRGKHRGYSLEELAEYRLPEG